MLQRLLPLYLLVLAGYMAGRYLRVRKDDFAALLIYFLLPVVVFFAILRAKLELQYLVLPLLFWAVCSVICLVSLFLAGPFYKSPAKNILAMASGNANSGYFGIPVGMALFGEQALSAIVLSSFGFTLYENTVGFYVSARGRHSHSESLSKVLRLPALYAFLAGLLANLAGLSFDPLTDLSVNIRGAYSVLGMMMIGLAIAEQPGFKADLGFAGFACSMKFVAWPLLVALVLFLDNRYFGVFDHDISQVVFFMATLPIAANTVAIAALLKTEPERAAVTVLIITLIALFAVPFCNGWYSGKL
jgi:malate permease and related proteins